MTYTQIGKRAGDGLSVDIGTDGAIGAWHSLLVHLELAPCLLAEHKCASCPLSAYVTVATEYRDEECLVAALEECGYTVERHKQPVNLHGYHGDVRPELANLIVRRRYIGGSSNDAGWLRNPDGSYSEIISEYDGGRNAKGGSTFTREIRQKIAQKYATRKVIKQAKQSGYQVAKQTTENGTVKMVLRRWS